MSILLNDDMNNLSEKENISLFSELQTKQGFSNYYKLNKNLNLLKNIKDKKTKIKKLIRITNEKDKYYNSYNNNNRKPSILLEFENNLKNTLFSKNGIVGEKIPFFKKCLADIELKKNTKLKEKINAGKLTYYFVKENENQLLSDKRKNFLKQRLIAFSNNYNISKDKDINLTLYKQKVKLINNKVDLNKIYDDLYNNNKQKTKNKININFMNNTLSLQKFNNINENYMNKSYQKTINIRKKILIPQLNINETNNIYNLRNNKFISNNNTTTDNQNSNENSKEFKSSKFSYFNNTLDNTTKYSNSKSFNNKNNNYINHSSNNLQSKINKIYKKQKNMEKKLIKIIYKNDYLEPLSLGFQRDVEVISDYKIKKRRKQKNKIINFVNNIKKIEGDYSNLNKKPRELLKISDNISKIKDENFLNIGKNIKNIYLKLSDEKKYMEIKEVLFSVEQTSQKKNGSKNVRNLKKIKKNHNLEKNLEKAENLSDDSGSNLNSDTNNSSLLENDMNDNNYINLSEEIKTKIVEEEEKEMLQKFIECFNPTSNNITLNTSFEENSYKEDDNNAGYQYLYDSKAKFDNKYDIF